MPVGQLILWDGLIDRGCPEPGLSVYPRAEAVSFGSGLSAAFIG